MTASRFVFLATTSAALLTTLLGCVGPTAPVTTVSHRGTSDLVPWSEPTAAPGTISGELRRGTPPLADDDVADITKPWPGVQVDILDPAGRKAAEAVSDDQGRFRVTVEPGDYVVKPLWPTTRIYPMAGAPPVSNVSVDPDATVSVRLYYNPGIL